MIELLNVFYRETVKKYAKVASASTDKKIVPSAKSEAFVLDGWTVVKQQKQQSHLERPVVGWQLLERKVWYLCYLLEFARLSDLKGAELRRDASTVNQIDVFASDDLVALVFECKHGETASSRSFDAVSDIPKLKEISDEVRKSYQQSSPANVPKVKGIMCVGGRKFTISDFERANSSNISLVSEQTIDYYIEFAKRSPKAAYFQFLGEVLSGEKIKSLEMKVPCVRTKIGNAVAYQLALTPTALLRMAYVAHRNAGKVGNYQRMVSKSRLASMQKFIDSGGFFPTNIVVNFRNDRGRPLFEPAVQESDANSETKFGMLRLPAEFGCAWVIDGQHRLMSYAGHKWADRTLLPVTAFDGLDREREAGLFEEINNNQKKVSASLLTELYAALHLNNPNARYQVRAMASATVDSLRQDPSSNFFGRIVGAEQKSSALRCVTVKAFSDELSRPGLFYRKLNGQKIQQAGPFWVGDAHESVERAVYILESWFSAIKSASGGLWQQGEPGIVATNRGIVASLRLLNDVIQQFRSTDPDFDALDSDQLCEKIQEYGAHAGRAFKELRDNALEEARQVFGSSAAPEFHFTLVRFFRENDYPDFRSEGFDKWLEEKSRVNYGEASELVLEMERAIQTHVKQKLQELDSEDPWLQVPLEIRKAAAALREEKGGREDQKWEFLYLINFRPIVQKHWSLFRNSLGSGDQSKDSGTQWLVDLNQIRSDLFHSGGSRLKSEQVAKLRIIKQTLVDSGILQQS